MRTGQLSFDDLGTFDYRAKSTAEKFLENTRGDFMTTNESLRLHGFWTHKETGECISVSYITKFGEAHARKANSLGHEVGPKEIMLIRDLKAEYAKGMR